MKKDRDFITAMFSHRRVRVLYFMVSSQPSPPENILKIPTDPDQKRVSIEISGDVIGTITSTVHVEAIGTPYQVS